MKEYVANKLSESEAYYSIVKSGGSQRQYYLQTDFFKKAVEEYHFFKEDPNFDYPRKEKDGNAYVLNDDYKFKLGPAILWLIGEEYNRDDNKLIISINDYNKITMATRNFSQMGNEKYPNSKKEDYEWFIKLYDNNISNTKLIFRTYEENNEKILELDIKPFNYMPVEVDDIEYPHNKIFFGAPGTGKSFELDSSKNDLLFSNEENYIRVTFHPDYSYSDFVGVYKPVTDRNGDIQYKFVSGPFLKILIQAIQNPKKPYLLIIEEINRANVSAVFGDTFQLLDRDDGGYSKFPISIPNDIKNHILKILENKSEEYDENSIEKEYKKYFPNDEMKIPKNMFIWATMNSADQGVFPMDTAFKRRWDFEYIDIDHSQNQNMGFIKTNKGKYEWNKIRRAINDFLIEKGINEDKCMGAFFIKDESEDYTEMFINKVLMYLFEDAARSIRKDLFTDENRLSYSKIREDFYENGLSIFKSENINSMPPIPENEDVHE